MNQEIIKDPGNTEIAHQHPQDKQSQKLGIGILDETLEPPVEDQSQGLAVELLQGIYELLIKAAHKGDNPSGYPGYLVGPTHTKAFDEYEEVIEERSGLVHLISKGFLFCYGKLIFRHKNTGKTQHDCIKGGH
jgi:hypothetical protein